jgi:hypothetical protein
MAQKLLVCLTTLNLNIMHDVSNGNESRKGKNPRKYFTCVFDFLAKKNGKQAV